MSCKLVLVSGGIGAGKSVVCKILQALGFDVYDCDLQAKLLLDTNPALCEYIDRTMQGFTTGSVIDSQSRLNRKQLADVVFSNREALKTLNSIVHPAILEDIQNRAERGQGILFVESAIPAESGLREIVDEEWIVFASDDVRISRVIQRNGLTQEQVQSRIDAQRSEWLSPHPKNHKIYNFGDHSLIMQLHDLLGQL